VTIIGLLEIEKIDRLIVIRFFGVRLKFIRLFLFEIVWSAWLAILEEII